MKEKNLQTSVHNNVNLKKTERQHNRNATILQRPTATSTTPCNQTQITQIHYKQILTTQTIIQTILQTTKKLIKQNNFFFVNNMGKKYLIESQKQNKHEERKTPKQISFVQTQKNKIKNKEQPKQRRVHRISCEKHQPFVT